MEIFKEQIDNIFSCLQPLLKDAFHTDAHLFTYPYDDLSKIDKGFRKMVWNTYSHPMPVQSLDSDESGYRLLIVKSTLGFYNLLAFVTNEQYPTFISIGPFRCDDLSRTAYQQLLKSRSLASEFGQMVQQFYRVLPLVDFNDITSFTMHFLGNHIPEFATIMPELISYSDETHEVTTNDSAFESYTFQLAENYAKLLDKFLNALVAGNLLNVSTTLKDLIDFSAYTVETPLTELRKFLLELNTHCKGKLLVAAIHPLYVLRLYQSYDVTISGCANPRKLLLLAYEVARKYCLLVKNFGFKEYSYPIRSVIRYISEHLDEDLSLSILAEQFERNPSALSGQFSKETSKSITTWIHEQRIKASLQYFHTSDLTVAEIASRVGIHDLSYFSKLFKKQVGQTPSHYRKMMQRSST